MAEELLLRISLHFFLHRIPLPLREGLGEVKFPPPLDYPSWREQNELSVFALPRICLPIPPSPT